MYSIMHDHRENLKNTFAQADLREFLQVLQVNMKRI